MNAVLIFSNFVVCMAILWSCICRMRLMNHETCLHQRLILASISVLAIASALQGPLFGSYPDLWEVCWSLAVWVCMTLWSLARRSPAKRRSK